MISESELLNGKKLEDLTAEQRVNFTVLMDKSNKLRKAYGKPLTVSSGVRTMADHLRIYKDKGITDQSKIPMRSKHLSAEACDVTCRDIKGLQKWITDNTKLMESIGLWFESFAHTPNWAHMQIVPPASGKRFFIP
jgi:hypothetical protein